MAKITLFNKSVTNVSIKLRTFERRSQFAKSVKNAQYLINVLMQDKHNSNHYLAIMQDVFGIQTNVSCKDVGFTLSELDKNTLIETPEKTAISFLVFANMMIRNKIAIPMDQFQQEYSPEQSPDEYLPNFQVNLPEGVPQGSQDLANQLNDLINLLGSALTYRADYADFDFKMNAALAVFGGAGATAIAATFFGGPIGVIVGLGAAIVASVAILIYFLSKEISPNSKSAVQEKMDDLVSEEVTIFGLLNQTAELKGFSNLLQGQHDETMTPNPNLDRKSLFELSK